MIKFPLWKTAFLINGVLALTKHTFPGLEEIGVTPVIFKAMYLWLNFAIGRPPRVGSRWAWQHINWRILSCQLRMIQRLCLKPSLYLKNVAPFHTFRPWKNWLNVTSGYTWLYLIALAQDYPWINDNRQNVIHLEVNCQLSWISYGSLLMYIQGWPVLTGLTRAYQLN